MTDCGFLSEFQIFMNRIKETWPKKFVYAAEYYSKRFCIFECAKIV